MNDEHHDHPEKICFLCRRPESKAGSMISLPNNIHICTECMQKSFDTMRNSNINYNDLMNLQNVSMIDLSNLHSQIPKEQKVKEKSEKKEPAKVFNIPTCSSGL